MPSKFFDYCGFSEIQIDAPTGLLRRISDNIEGEIAQTGNVNCRIKIEESDFPVEIKKDRRFKYAAIEKSKVEGEPTFRYYRYDTHIRTIKQKSFSHYEIDNKTQEDESSALICIRNHLSNNSRIDYPLLHASLVDVKGSGVLVAGGSMQGKTTMMIYLLQECGGTFVGDENIFLDSSSSKLRGLYVPRMIRVRFPTIAQSRLSDSLEDLSLTDATQYLDSDFIQQKLKSKDYTGEWGLAFSRKSFCQLLDADSAESSSIETVILPVYKEQRGITTRDVEEDEGIEKLSISGLVKKSEMNLRELQDTGLDLSSVKGRKLNFLEVAFSRIEELIKGGFKL